MSTRRCYAVFQWGYASAIVPIIRVRLLLETQAAARTRPCRLITRSTANHDSFRDKIENMPNTTGSASNVVKVELGTQKFHTCVVVARVICCESIRCGLECYTDMQSPRTSRRCCDHNAIRGDVANQVRTATRYLWYQ